jgi:mRNA-degrading endonuclease toxin of MazEF toxin-antitoxin module
MAPRDRQRLLDQALALPDAQLTDFFGGRRPPGDAHPGHLKVIKDTVLRARLIGANLAEGLQSPKGPQKIASILRLYPDFNAPSHAGAHNGHSNGHVVRATRGTPGRKPAQLPTVEELEALITRIRAVEGHVARELSMTIDQEIDQLKRKVAEARPDELNEAFAALGAAIAKRNDSSAHVREEAFRRIEKDTDFPQRAHLRYIAKP